PRVGRAMDTWKAGVSGAEFEVKASDPSVQKFVEDELRKFWEGSLDQVQCGDEWGWSACQCFYTVENGLLCTCHLDAFESRDCVALVAKNKFVGFRVRNVRGVLG